jgi:hypothetical protein
MNLGVGVPLVSRPTASWSPPSLILQVQVELFPERLPKVIVDVHCSNNFHESKVNIYIYIYIYILWVYDYSIFITRSLVGHSD